MRLLELILILISALSFAAFGIPMFRRRLPTEQAARLGAAFIAAAGRLVVLHLLVGGYRWQMIPVFLLIPRNAVILLNGQRPIPRWLVTSSTILSITCLILGIAGTILLPVPRLPNPPGPYAIGTFTQTWVDESRRGIY